MAWERWYLFEGESDSVRPKPAWVRERTPRRKLNRRIL